MSEYVIVVDDLDREVGREEKLVAHLTCQLHRAISVFVFAADGRMLLQRRSRRQVPLRRPVVEHLLRPSSPRRIVG